MENVVKPGGQCQAKANAVKKPWQMGPPELQDPVRGQCEEGGLATLGVKTPAGFVG